MRKPKLDNVSSQPQVIIKVKNHIEINKNEFNNISTGKIEESKSSSKSSDDNEDDDFIKQTKTECFYQKGVLKNKHDNHALLNPSKSPQLCKSYARNVEKVHIDPANRRKSVAVPLDYFDSRTKTASIKSKESSKDTQMLINKLLYHNDKQLNKVGTNGLPIVDENSLSTLNTHNSMQSKRPKKKVKKSKLLFAKNNNPKVDSKKNTPRRKSREMTEDETTVRNIISDAVSVKRLRGKSDNENIQSSIKNKDLNEFNIISKIGHGSYGQVYLVTYKQNMKIYALKVIKKKMLKSDKDILSIKREKYVLKTLKDNPFIVNLYYTFQDNK